MNALALIPIIIIFHCGWSKWGRKLTRIPEGAFVVNKDKHLGSIRVFIFNCSTYKLLLLARRQYP